MSAISIPASSTSSSAPITRPYDERYRSVEYVSPDGNVGETRYPINYEEVYNLKGRLLTLIDATNGDPQQRKALKDLVWQTLQHWMNDIQQAAGREPSPVGVNSEDKPGA
jgi:hypothetical protein